jgi:hypothetical protein
MPEVEYPALFAAADAAALAGERWYARLVEIDLSLVMATALIAGIGSAVQPSWRQILAVIAVIVIGTAVILRWVNRALRRDKVWFDGRSVAESVKTASWRYMMRAAPFDINANDADGRLVSELEEILRARKDLPLDPAKSTGPQITPPMREVRKMTFDSRKAFYLERRLADQVQWYSGRASLHRSRARWWFGVGLGAEIVALIWALVRVIWTDAANLIGFFTSLAAAATAFAQLQRNDELARSYTLAAQELQLIRSLMEGANIEARFLELIENSEGAISREHTMWMAKRT